MVINWFKATAISLVLLGQQATATEPLLFPDLVILWGSYYLSIGSQVEFHRFIGTAGDTEATTNALC